MSSSLKHARPECTWSLISSFQLRLFSVPVFVVPEPCVLNRLLSLRSLLKPLELLFVERLEPHEPQVGHSALSVGSPLPQGVQWHQHPQWLLSVHQHYTAVATQHLRPCAGPHSSTCWGSEAKAIEGQFNLWNQRTRWAVCTVPENLATLHLKSPLPYFSSRVEGLFLDFQSADPVVCLPSCYHVLHRLLSNSSA